MNFHTFKNLLKVDVNLVVIVLMILLTNSNIFRMKIIFVRIGGKAATVIYAVTINVVPIISIEFLIMPFAWKTLKLQFITNILIKSSLTNMFYKLDKIYDNKVATKAYDPFC